MNGLWAMIAFATVFWTVLLFGVAVCVYILFTEVVCGPQCGVSVLWCTLVVGAGGGADVRTAVTLLFHGVKV
jgi:hypothetical protein